MVRGSLTTKGKRDTPNKRRLVFMSKPLVFDDRKPADKPKPGHFILTSQGWYQVKRGNRYVKWEPLDKRNVSL